MNEHPPKDLDNSSEAPKDPRILSTPLSEEQKTVIERREHTEWLNTLSEQELDDYFNKRKDESHNTKEVNKNATTEHSLFEGKSQSEIADTLIADPTLIHFLYATRSGLDIQKIVSGEKRYGKYNNPFEGLDDFDFRSKAILRDKQLFEATPLSRDFPQGKGFGILFPVMDDVNRYGFSNLWTIVPNNNEELGAYIQQNPEILVEILKKEFKEEIKSNGQPINENRIELASRDFVQI